MRTVRDFDHDRDADWLYALWHQTLDPLWALKAADLKQRVAASKVALVAELNGAPVGFCSADYQSSGAAALLVMLVDSSFRRIGIGSMLLKSLEQTLRTHEVTSVSLGYEGSSDYFWPGVPESQHEAWHFFASQGWQPQERNFDLLIDLTTYRMPGWVTDRMHASGVTLHFADSLSAESIIHFERCSFPKWAPFYENALRLQAYKNVLFAEAADGIVVGTVLLNGDELLPWNEALGSRCGSFAVLGVAKDMEGRGIGTALAARAAEVVKERGCSACYIDWTGLVTWYGKIGATVWTAYRTSTRRPLANEAEHAVLCSALQRKSSLEHPLLSAG